MSLSRFSIRCIIAIVPFVLITIFYYGSFFFGSLRQSPYPLVAGVSTHLFPGKQGLRGGSGDAAFYTVQTWRTGKLLQGRWWKQIQPLGGPQDYPPDSTRLPHVFEGVDTMLLSAVTCLFLPDIPDLSHNTPTRSELPGHPVLMDPDQNIFQGGLSAPILNFNILSVLVLLINGWVFGGYLYAVTSRLWPALLAQILITLNWSTAFQFNTHLNWYKHAWILIVVITAFRLWETPSARRAVFFGLATAGLIQSSWYFTYLLMLAFFLAGGILVACKVLQRTHIPGLIISILVAGIVGGLLTFPYWAQKHGQQEQFKKRDLRDLIWFSSEPSHYLLPLWSQPGKLYHEARVRYSPLASDKEIWHYPGIVILLSMIAYGAWVLRRHQTTDRDQQRLDFLALMISLLVFVSLSGGISIIMFKFAPQFRVYGRAGTIAVGLSALMVPLFLHRCLNAIHCSLLRRGVISLCFVVALFDGWWCYQAVTPPKFDKSLNLPGWVPWLAQQDKSQKAVILPIVPEDYTQSYWWIFHRHDVLNTCDVRPFQREVEQIDAPDPQTISPALIEILKKHGYRFMIVQNQLWKQFPWMDKPGVLTKIQDGLTWRVYQIPDTFDYRQIQVATSSQNTTEAVRHRSPIPALTQKQPLTSPELRVP